MKQGASLPIVVRNSGPYKNRFPCKNLPSLNSRSCDEKGASRHTLQNELNEIGKLFQGDPLTRRSRNQTSCSCTRQSADELLTRFPPSGEPGVLTPWSLCSDRSATKWHLKVTRVITDPARQKIFCHFCAAFQ